MATSNGNAQVVEMLISNGAGVYEKDNAGWSPLMWASSFGRAEMVVLLLSKGANPYDRANDGAACFDKAMTKDKILFILRKWHIIVVLGIYFFVETDLD